MSLHSFREKVNLQLFGSKIPVLIVLRILSVLVIAMATGALVYYYGYPHDDYTKQQLLSIIRLTFGFFAFNYLVKILYTFEPRQFFRSTWVEGLLCILILVNGLSGLMGFTPMQGFFRSVGFNNYNDLYIISLQLVLIFIIFIQFVKASSFFSELRMSPSSLFMLSFVVLILIGTFLLHLPEMTIAEHHLTWLDAIFTSTSACCVTGLTVVDTATIFTLKGKLIILCLIQLGGLSIISFATFFASFSSKGSGIKHQSLMQEYFSTDSLLNAKGMLRQIITMSIVIEIIGTLIIFSLWDSKVPFASTPQKIFYSLFHAVAAFNNCSFTLFSDGFYNASVRNSFVLHLAIAALIVFGSLGFATLRELFGVKQLRERLRLPWKTVSVSSRIALYSTIALGLLGAISFYFIEHNNTLAGHKPVEQAITSIFMSVTCRTAGLSVVPVSQLMPSMLLIMMFLMFIGASSGSTGGGIKTSSFTLIFISAYNTLRGRQRMQIFKHSVYPELLNKAFTILVFALTYIFFSTVALCITEPGQQVLHLAFEEVSAFSTVGLSTGLTSALSPYGKFIVIASMFVGRIGPLTLAFAIAKRPTKTNYKYSTAHVIVG